MKNISEYKKVTSVFELSAHLYEKIINGKIQTFSELKEYSSIIPRGTQIQIILMNAFKLIRNLYWGFFKDIDYPSYPKVWKEIVIPDGDYKYAGDLKRNMTISSIYIAMMDIHGYTKFCKQSNRNISMLELLDKFIQSDISKITQENNVVSRRAMGDEIILVGTCATDIINSVLSIIDYFGKRKIIKSEELSKSRPGARIMLPDMHVSAGIAGGKIYTPLIITGDGDLSGDVVNTAARLQSRANKISPDSTRVIITKHIRYKYLKEQKSGEVSTVSDLRFFNSGIIEFKGISISLFYLIYRETDYYILNYQEEMLKLYDSIESKLWKNKVFPNLISLLVKVLIIIPPFKIKSSMEDGKVKQLHNSDLIELAGKCLNYYSVKMDYSKAVKTLGTLINHFKLLKTLDRLVFQYTIDIHKIYSAVLYLYENELEKLLEKRIVKILSFDEQKTYNIVKKHFYIYEKLRNNVRNSPDLCNRKSLWYTFLENSIDNINLNIYSGKS